MTSAIKSSYTSEQISAWLRGLLTIAWADGHFDPEEQELIQAMTQDELAPKMDLGSLEPISASELAAIFADDGAAAENFLRTAVMVALANGVYSVPEDRVVREFFQALGQETDTLDALQHTMPAERPEGDRTANVNLQPLPAKGQPDVLKPVRVWLDDLDVQDPRVARFLCKMIPAQCPFERDIKLFGRKTVHIPPLCKINPLYEQLVGLRFRALSFLADKCGEDVSPYC